MDQEQLVKSATQTYRIVYSSESNEEFLIMVRIKNMD